MDNLNLIDLLKETTQNVFDTLKVGSIAEVVEVKDDSFYCRLMPKIQGRDIYVNTLNVIADVEKFDKVVLLFVDYNSNLQEQQSLMIDTQPHTHNNAVVLMKVYKNLSDIPTTKKEKE